ncbi:TIGR03089 family protein [Cellulomonas cellasea]|uniref:TIGR03089 family protein n=2 Tax=Cellulomonas cellasea TaxID=43670 RepID=A0A0A0B233_9CELL|nr:TIGR03089 family protein [Cellulomonas cellasea]KGM00860.1 hypothetical protein Q760_05600 [Cellulomonas cellasea DSM 20118]
MPPSTVADVLSALQPEPGRPRLTWYGPDGERVELSGTVLDNWVTKTANLLVEELDAGPGTRVSLDLPPHWRTLVWALATWRVGACVELLGAGGSGADVVVTHRPGSTAGGPPVVAVPLAALARRFDGDLPAGALDAAAAVMTYGDALGWTPPRDGAAPAVAATAGVVDHDGLLGWAAGSSGAPLGARTLLRLPTSGHDTAGFLRAALDVLAGEGSVVVVTAGADGSDDARVDRIVETERVTALSGTTG